MDDLDGRGIEENSSSSESESRPLTERRKGLATHTNRLRDKLERLLQEEDPAELDLDELQESKALRERLLENMMPFTRKKLMRV